MARFNRNLPEDPRCNAPRSLQPTGFDGNVGRNSRRPTIMKMGGGRKIADSFVRQVGEMPSRRRGSKVARIVVVAEQKLVRGDAERGDGPVKSFVSGEQGYVNC